MDSSPERSISPFPTSSASSDSESSCDSGAESATPSSPTSDEAEVHGFPTGIRPCYRYSSAVAKRKLFVGGLPFHTSSAALRKHFDQYGPIDEAVVIYDRVTAKSKGYGFVIMSIEEDAEKACMEPHPMIEGRKANVNIAIIGAKPKRSKLTRRLLACPNAMTTMHTTPPPNRLHDNIQHWYVQVPAYHRNPVQPDCRRCPESIVATQGSPLHQGTVYYDVARQVPSVVTSPNSAVTTAQYHLPGRTGMDLAISNGAGATTSAAATTPGGGASSAMLQTVYYQPNGAAPAPANPAASPLHSNYPVMANTFGFISQPTRAAVPYYVS